MSEDAHAYVNAHQIAERYQWFPQRSTRYYRGRDPMIGCFLGRDRSKHRKGDVWPSLCFDVSPPAVELRSRSGNVHVPPSSVIVGGETETTRLPYLFLWTGLDRSIAAFPSAAQLLTGPVRGPWARAGRSGTGHVAFQAFGKETWGMGEVGEIKKGSKNEKWFFFCPSLK